MVQKIYFVSFFTRETSRMRTAAQSENVKVRSHKSRAAQIKNQNVWWVAISFNLKPSLQIKMK